MATVTEVKVPDIGDFKDVPVIEVLVKPGDKVAVEDALVTLESDKATMDVPAPSAGTVKELKLKVGDKVSEGTVILLLDAGAAAARGPRLGAEDRDFAAAVADELARRGRRSSRSRHRRFQGRAGDRGAREAGRYRQGGRRAGHARIGQGDDGRAGAVRRHRAGGEARGRRQGFRGRCRRHARDLGASRRRHCPLRPTRAASPAPAAAPLAPAQATSTPAPAAAPASAVDEAAFALAYASPAVRKLARELGVDLGA